MINAKQRAALRKLGNTLNPIFQIGKGDLTPALVQGIDEALEKRELIKISVLETANLTAQEAAQTVAERTHSDVVQCIGRKFVIYRESREHKRIDLLAIQEEKK